MSKRSILKRAAQEAQPVKQGERRSERQTPANSAGEARSHTSALDAVDVDEIAAKVADALWARLARVLPICARLAAADTLRTQEHAETVMRRAIKEGLKASEILREVLADGQ